LALGSRQDGVMQITTSGLHGWVVRADWFGAERTVFEGSLFDCIAFVADHG
jgi:hypothetical protein